MYMQCKYIQCEIDLFAVGGKASDLPYFFFNRKRVTLLFLRPQLTINLLRYNINTPKKLKRSNIERGKELLQMNDEVEQWKTDIKVYSKKRSSTRLRGTPRMGPIAG